MNKLLFNLLGVLLLVGCSLKEEPIYKDLSFGMSLEEVQSLGYCMQGEFMEEGYVTYFCTESDFEDLQYDTAKLHFKDNKLAKISFYKSTYSGNEQREFSRKIRDYLVSKYGQEKEVGKCLGWKDDKNTFIVYPHCNLTGKDMQLIYINELAIFSNKLNPRK
jgi:hypothetical protein